MVEVMAVTVTTFRRAYASAVVFSAHSRPLSTHASTRDFWTLTSKSGSVSCGVATPFSWVLVCTRFCLCPPGVYFSSLVEVL